MVRRVALLLFSLGLAHGVSSCQCNGGFPDLFYDDFQSRCAELPCEWSLAAGSASIVTTYHSAAQGLRISGGAVVVRDLPEVLLPSTGPTSGVVLFRALVSCEPESSLEVEVLGRESDTQNRVTLSGSVGHDPGANIPFPSVSISLSAEEDTLELEAMSIRLRVVGAGSCTVDELHLLDGDRVICDG